MSTTALAAPTTHTAAPAAVRFRSVGKRYGHGPAVLDGVELTVEPGEFLCLVGASGSGKSTILSLAAGLEQPSTGSVEVAGERAALVFQEHALFPWLTAGRNVELALRLRGVPRRERREQADALLRRVHLERFAGARVHELSGGMRQRVAIARALAQDSHVLLMDEPFAALDAITRDALHDELTWLHAETGVAVVFVTHNVREAVRLGQRVVLLGSHPGRIVRAWTVDIAQPRRIEAPGVAALATEVTDALHEEMRRDHR